MEDWRNYFKGILPPPIIFFILILISFLAQRMLPVNLIFNNWYTRLFVSVPILAVSGWLAIDAMLILRKNRTAITYNKPATKFVIERSFRITRNPLYLSLLLVVVSLIVISNSFWYCVTLLLLFIFFDQFVVPREERYLEKIFGEDYIKYKNSVSRWV